MKVTPYKDEPHTFLVEGRTLVCSNAGLSGSECRFRSVSKRRKAGDQCPRCKRRGAVGSLVPRQHLVDTSALDANGWCACEEFDYDYRPEVERMTLEERLQKRLRCPHILAAREFDLDRELLRHSIQNRLNERT